MAEHEHGTQISMPSITHELDWFLQILVDLVNKTGLGIPITLLVGGSIVTGLLASGKDYFNNFADELKGSFSGMPDFSEEAAESLVSGYREIAKGIYDPTHSEGADQTSTAPAPLPQFVHLRNAYILVPGQLEPKDRPIWWRGRLASVDAFFLGTLNQS